MPDFMNRPTEGMCERLGGRCMRKEHFVDSANLFLATPKQYTSTINYGESAKTTWYFWGLNVPEDQVDDVNAEIVKNSPDMAFDNGYVLPHWLKEFPCYIGCDITVCNICKKQHEKNAVVDGICKYDVEEKRLAEIENKKKKELAELHIIAAKKRATIVAAARDKAIENVAKARENGEKTNPVADAIKRLSAPAQADPAVAAAAKEKTKERLGEISERTKNYNGKTVQPPRPSWAAVQEKYINREQAKIDAGVIAPGDTGVIGDSADEDKERKI